MARQEWLNNPKPALTRKQLAIFVILFTGLTYACASWAIDSGSWWAYLFTFFFLVCIIRSLFHLVKKHGKK